MAFINYNEPDAAAVFLTEFESRDRMIEPRLLLPIKTPQAKTSSVVIGKLNIHHRKQTACCASVSVVGHVWPAYPLRVGTGPVPTLPPILQLEPLPHRRGRR